MSEITGREALSEAIRYWEPRRILYNALLLIEVAVVFWVNLPESRSHFSLNIVLLLFVLAVLANVAYCAYYVVDVLAQLSAFRVNWLRLRWLLLIVGVAFAGTLTYFFACGFFLSA
jgi:hypothetical protein